MGKSLCIGFFTTFIFLYISLFILPGFLEDSIFMACTLAALLFGMVATCTSMILKKLNALLELTAAQSAKLRSLEAKNADNKASSDD